MTFFDTFILEGKNKPAMSHQAVNLLYDYVTLWEEKKIMLARCCPINIVFHRMHYWIMMQMVHLHTCNMHTNAAHAPCLHFISWKKIWRLSTLCCWVAAGMSKSRVFKTFYEYLLMCRYADYCFCAEASSWPLTPSNNKCEHQWSYCVCGPNSFIHKESRSDKLTAQKMVGFSSMKTH